ncbi:MAG: thiamine phosphate synthase [Terriglobales bacterium]|jgi:thiamine-phosphate pyrophosphorylase
MSDRSLLYYITDRSQFSGNESSRRQALLAKIAEATTARVDYIQLREKDLPARELEALAKEALIEINKIKINDPALRTENRELRTREEPRTHAKPGSTRLLINSRTDLALAAGAHGVHLRSDDVTPTEVRRSLELTAHRPPPTAHFLVVVSCHSQEDVQRAESEALASEVDFAVFAPVFGKRGYAGTPPAGLAALQKACQSKLPILALGGVTLENAAACLHAGAAGIAGIRLFQENKIEDVVRALRPL